MKVFELMAELAKCNAGAEVEFSTVILAQDLKETDTEGHYHFAVKIKDVDLIHTGLIALHD